MDKKMSRRQFKKHIQVHAMILAMLHYRHNHLGVSDEQAEAYAVDHWRPWVDTALEFIAFEQIREAEKRRRR